LRRAGDDLDVAALRIFRLDVGRQLDTDARPTLRVAMAFTELAAAPAAPARQGFAMAADRITQRCRRGLDAMVRISDAETGAVAALAKAIPNGVPRNRERSRWGRWIAIVGTHSERIWSAEARDPLTRTRLDGFTRRCAADLSDNTDPVDDGEAGLYLLGAVDLHTQLAARR
jgi:hypothetical protein